MPNSCETCGGHGWSEDPHNPHSFTREACPTCKGSGRSKPAVTDYSDLTPPENPDYPWKANDWQLLCYYCAQPIEIGKPVAGYRQRTIFMRGMWRHKDGNLNCVKSMIRPDIDPPRCHICGTQTPFHAPICSAAGTPACNAKPMSAKEEELIRRFGWNTKIKEEEKKQKQTPALETVGTLTVAGVLLGLLAWAAKLWNATPSSDS